jgi:polysaccharide chain length determinant protein (PEP-CTERM system associated)
MVRRRGAVACGIALGVFLASAVLAGWLPNRYEAYTTLLVEPQTISPELVPTGVQQTDLNQRLHLMTMQILSRARLSSLIDALKLYPEESERMTREEVIALMRDRIRIEPVLPELEQQQAIRKAEAITINTFRLYFVHENADTAAAVTNRLANDFIEEHIKERVQISGDTSEFIESELARLATRIQEVDARIAQVKSENPGRLPEDLGSNQRLLERALDNQRAAQRELAEAQSDEAFYRQQSLASAGDVKDDNSPLTRLKALEIALAGYRSRGYTDKHPDIIATQAEIDMLRKSMTGGPAPGGDASSMSVAQANAEAERRRAGLQVAAAQEAVQRLSAQVDEIQKQLAETPRVTEQLAALEREYRHLSDSVQLFSQKRLEAGVAANMERRQKGEQVRILETAYPPPEPTSPNRLLILTLGAIFGIALGSSFGLLLEATDSSFHGLRQAQTALRMPVIATIPKILLDADRVRARRHRMRVGAVAVVAVMLALTTAAGGYLYRRAGTGAAPAAATPAAPAAPAPAPANGSAAAPTPGPG